jgi:hypothetical protein
MAGSSLFIRALLLFLALNLEAATVRLESGSNAGAPWRHIFQAV